MVGAGTMQSLQARVKALGKDNADSKPRSDPNALCLYPNSAETG